MPTPATPSTNHISGPISSADDGLDALADSDLLTTARAARALGFTAKTLSNWRALGKGPDFIRIGSKHGAVRYEKSALVRFKAQHAVAARSGAVQ